MWEWSSRNNQSSFKPSTSLLNAYDDLTSNLSHETQYKPEIKEVDILSQNKASNNNLKFEDVKDLVKAKISEYKLKNIILIEKDYEPQTWQEMAKSFLQYNHMRHCFLKLMAYSNRDECLSAGLSKDDIELMKNGVAPENFNTHLKIPFDFGGKLDYSNLSLVKTHHTHHHLHRVIDMQIENDFLRTYKKIFIPFFEGKIYYD